MLKVILVDDEPLVIEGLLAMVNWQSYGYKVSGVAYNGEEGLELIKTIQPDLVITDIKMPGLDGLSMISQARKMGFCESGFMILSGYNEFDYVKSAMDLRSFNYILKPIDPDEIHEELAKHFDSLSKQKALEERVQRNISAVGRMTLERLLSQQATDKLIGRLKFLMNFTQDTRYQLGYLRFDPSIKSKLCAELDPFPEQILYNIHDEGSLWCLICDGANHTLEDTTHLLKKGLSEKLNLQINLSRIDQDLHHLLELKDGLLELDKYHFYWDNEETYEGEKNLSNEKLSHNMGLFDPVKIMTYIQGDRIENLDYQLQEDFIKIRRAHMDPDLLKMRVNTLVDMLERLYPQKVNHSDVANVISLEEKTYQGTNQHELDQKNDDMAYSSMIKNADSYHELKKITIDMCRKYWHEIQRKQEPKVTTDVIKYMKEHYYLDIKLKITAKEFGYNSVYLGQLFQQETGMKYNDYLLKIRLEKAKELLLYSNMNVKEIAKEVGFKSGDYFVKKFKEMVGESPKRYRPS